METIKIKGGLR